MNIPPAARNQGRGTPDVDMSVSAGHAKFIRRTPVELNGPA